MPPVDVAGREANGKVILGEAESIDRFARTVILGDGEIGYDYLIIASGATHSYFGHDAWERHAPGLKTLEDALEIRRRVLVAYEVAEREPDPEIAHEWMTFVIVGAGPTGVELAGALAEISRRVLARLRTDRSKARKDSPGRGDPARSACDDAAVVGQRAPPIGAAGSRGDNFNDGSGH
jgi:NADH dehydrogenase FAD-containing subunit